MSKPITCIEPGLPRGRRRRRPRPPARRGRASLPWNPRGVRPAAVRLHEERIDPWTEQRAEPRLQPYDVAAQHR